MAMIAKNLNEAAQCINGGHDSMSVGMGSGLVTLEIRVHHDQDATPMDAECYSAEDIQRWRNDGWSYVGIVVTWGDAQASLWGIERNFKDDETVWFEGHLRDLVREVVAELGNEVKRIDTASRLLREMVVSRCPDFCEHDHREQNESRGSTV